MKLAMVWHANFFSLTENEEWRCRSFSYFSLFFDGGSGLIRHWAHKKVTSPQPLLFGLLIFFFAYAQKREKRIILFSVICKSNIQSHPSITSANGRCNLGGNKTLSIHMRRERGIYSFLFGLGGWITTVLSRRFVVPPSSANWWLWDRGFPLRTPSVKSRIVFLPSLYAN